jgi:hypothetical protein
MPVALARTRPGVRTTKLPSGESVPVLGQGTWHLGEDWRRRKDEIAAPNLGIDLGMTLIDTAEMYANGEAEVLVGEAIAALKSFWSARCSPRTQQEGAPCRLRGQPAPARNRLP